MSARVIIGDIMQSCAVVCHSILLEPIWQSRGCLERCGSPASGLAALVSHTCMQVPGVSAAVKTQAICCRTGDEQCKER